MQLRFQAIDDVRTNTIALAGLWRLTAACMHDVCMQVRFGVIEIRNHFRSLGASGGVPQRGGIALGISDDFEELEPMSVDHFETQRAPARTEKDALTPEPARRRKLLLQESMGKDAYVAVVSSLSLL